MLYKTNKINRGYHGNQPFWPCSTEYIFLHFWYVVLYICPYQKINISKLLQFVQDLINQMRKLNNRKKCFFRKIMQIRHMLMS